MPVDVDIQLVEAFGQVKSVLASNLAGELSSQESYASGNYTLPAPETYVLGKTPLGRVFTRTNVDEVAVWVSQASPSEPVASFSGQPNERKKDWDTVFRIGVMLREPGAVDPMPQQWPDGTSLGRDLIMPEYQTARGQLYKGAVIDAITNNRAMLNGGAHVTSLQIDSNFADTTTVDQSQISNRNLFARAIVDFEFRQDTLIQK